MALKQVKMGRRLIPTGKPTGTGWVNVTLMGSTSPYITNEPGLRGVPHELHVTANNCSGIRIIDWGISPNHYREDNSPGSLNSTTCVISGRGYGAVVRVLNPTDSTQVTVVANPIPPAV